VVAIVDSGDRGCVDVSQVLGGLVDIPASFSRHGVPSLGAVCIAALAVEVEAVWVVESTVQVVVVWVLESTQVAVSASLCILVSVLPTPQPSSNPSSYPSSRAVLSRLQTSSIV
jgi:hypothetical protein